MREREGTKVRQKGKRNLWMMVGRNIKREKRKVRKKNDKIRKGESKRMTKEGKKIVKRR